MRKVWDNMLKIGDAIPHKLAMPIVIKGRPQWYALKSAPQSETKLKQWLKAKGVYSFFPVTTVRKRQSMYLPGYVFARFDGNPVWNRLFDQCRFASDVIRYNLTGNPGELNPVDLERLHAMAGIDDESISRKRRARTIRKGDRVNFTFGGIPFENVEVVEMCGMHAKVKIGLIGESNMAVPVNKMDKVGI